LKGGVKSNETEGETQASKGRGSLIKEKARRKEERGGQGFFPGIRVWVDSGTGQRETVLGWKRGCSISGSRKEEDDLKEKKGKTLYRYEKRHV